MRKCWEEKQLCRLGDWYSKERKRYYNRNGWGLAAVNSMAIEERNLVKELGNKDRDTQRQREAGLIRDANYNKKYKECVEEGIMPRYLERERIEDLRDGRGVRALIRLRCGNMEEDNKYWLAMDKRACMFCGEGRDNFKHFIRECRVAKI